MLPLTALGRLARVALAATLLLQVVVVYAPQTPGPPPAIPHADKLIHAVVFALPVLAVGLPRVRWWPVVALLLALHAPVSEITQHLLLPGRSGDPWDVVADLVGVGIASGWVAWSVRRLRRRH